MTPIKKISFTNSRNISLVGSFFDAASDRGVVMAHGFYGDRTRHGRFDALGSALQNRDIAALSFDFSGCGESGDDTIDIEKEVDDMHAAIAWLRAQGKTRIGLLGYSLGALIAARVWSEDIRCLVLWAPVSRTKNDPRKGFSQEELAELDAKGYITKHLRSSSRSTVVIDKDYLPQRKAVDQKTLLENITSPVLIMHGDADEKQSIENSISAMQYLNQNSKLEIIKGGKHDLTAHMKQYIDLSVGWFIRHL